MKSFINTTPHPPPRLIARLAGNGRGLGFWCQDLSLNLSLLVRDGRSGQYFSWNVSRCVSRCPASQSVVPRPSLGDVGTPSLFIVLPSCGLTSAFRVLKLGPSESPGNRLREYAISEEGRLILGTMYFGHEKQHCISSSWGESRRPQ